MLNKHLISDAWGYFNRIPCTSIHRRHGQHFDACYVRSTIEPCLELTSHTTIIGNNQSSCHENLVDKRTHTCKKKHISVWKNIILHVCKHKLHETCCLLHIYALQNAVGVTMKFSLYFPSLLNSLFIFGTHTHKMNTSTNEKKKNTAKEGSRSESEKYEERWRCWYDVRGGCNLWARFHWIEVKCAASTDKLLINSPLKVKLLVHTEFVIILLLLPRYLIITVIIAMKFSGSISFTVIFFVGEQTVSVSEMQSHFN